MDSLRAGQVCRSWREASLKPVVSTSSKVAFDLSPFLPLRDPDVALRLLQIRGLHAVGVNLGYIRLSSSLASFVPFFSPALRALDVSSITSKKWVTDETIDVLTTRCQSLTRLNVFGCWLLTDASLKWIGSRCVHVRLI